MSKRVVLLACFRSHWTLSVWPQSNRDAEEAIHTRRTGCSLTNGYGSKICVEVEGVTTDVAALDLSGYLV
jgi:hypothetical protein